MIVFFFFKQKTAYEMRISDWSSDVCSSDLIKRAVGDAITAVLVTHAHPDHAPGARELARYCGVPVYGSGIALAGVSTPGFAPDRVQIGRASCRDSVCP